ncbi:MAG TPA: phospholipase D-like domain-containing protein [Vicinamibacterales bacterium]|nr:phospholipase D-like domain-containing protein [Vicinamibacterales bacterium]
MQLIIQPDDGIAPLIEAMKRARKTIDIVIFRFDIDEIADALTQAVERGIAVRALIAHTNRGGEGKLRKLEQKLLKVGVTLSRTADDMVRYHGKLLVVDRNLAYVLGFNYTHQDVEKSRSFGLGTRNPKIVRDVMKVIEADHNRTDPPSISSSRVVVSPENAREVLSEYIRKARKELLIYDVNLSDDRMLTLIKQRAAAGVAIKVIGEVEKKWVEAIEWRIKPFNRLKLHVRAIIRDGRSAFVGSQSLRKLELDERREVGLITRDRRVVKRMTEMFASDWKRG